MICFTREQLHLLLGNFPEAQTKHFLSSKSRLRRTIEQLRGDLEQHRNEKYVHMNESLNPQDMETLVNAIRTYTNTTQHIGNMDSIDNKMLHNLMCEGLLCYELELSQERDSYRHIIDDYFYALNRDAALGFSDNANPVDIFFQHLTKNPACYVFHTFTGGHDNSYSIPMLGLSECGCVDISHDRLLGDVRIAVEGLVIERCRAIYALHPDKCINLLSFGAGEGLQDFVLIFKLFRMGIQNIHLTLIEPNYSVLLKPEERYVECWEKGWKKGQPIPADYFNSAEKKLYSIIRALSLLTRSFNRSNLTISQYASVINMDRDRRMLAPIEQQDRSDEMDIVYAIDIEDYTSNHNNAQTDFLQTAKFLSADGTAVLSYHHEVEQFKLAVNVQGAKVLNMIAKTTYERAAVEKDTKYYVRKRNFDFGTIKPQAPISAAPHAALFQLAPAALVNGIALAMLDGFRL